MGLSRRGFFKTLGIVGAGTCVAGLSPQKAQASTGEGRNSADDMGVLVDTTRCIGCRRCEYACQQAAGFNPPPEETFRSTAPLAEFRRPYARSYTVINRFASTRPDGPREVFNKFNCLHCNDPACMSACLVTAFHKTATGAVVYDPTRCMGCRYCMVACPFEIPAYDYNNPLTPQVRKCNLCAHLVPDKQEVPACVKICPAEVLTYAKRADLLRIAHERISAHPGEYVDHVYGEHEAGGTLWLWISSIPFEKAGFRHFETAPPPRLTEKIQHNVFKKFAPPLMWYGLLGAVMCLTRPAPNPDDAKAPNPTDFAI